MFIVNYFLMNRLFFAAALMAASALSMAQTEKNQPREAQRRQWVESVKSPEVSANGEVTFRLSAPQAKEVRLSCQACPTTPMVKDEQEGVWKVTVKPAVADIYPYNFIVDGMAVSDPANKEVFPNELFKASLLEMPNPDMLYTVRNIPHGQVRHCSYFSTVLGEQRTMLVYTPANYDRDQHSQYPVFYLVSGTTDTEETWHKAGRANYILDNLIHDGKAQKMIVVMPYGNMNTGNPMPSSDEATQCYEVFAREMEECVMPYVEQHFRTQTNRESRAIAGFSRGGGEALFTGFCLQDKFASVCAYSAYLTRKVYEEKFPSIINNVETTNRQYRLIWFGVGDKDILVDGVKDNEAYFREKGVEFEQYDTTGGHTWMNARKFLGITAQKLFK